MPGSGRARSPFSRSSASASISPGTPRGSNSSRRSPSSIAYPDGPSRAPALPRRPRRVPGPPGAKSGPQLAHGAIVAGSSVRGPLRELESTSASTPFLASSGSVQAARSKQQGRRFPERSFEMPTSTRRLRVSGFLVVVIQRTHSQRAMGVMSLHSSQTSGASASAAREIGRNVRLRPLLARLQLDQQRSPAPGVSAARSSPSSLSQCPRRPSGSRTARNGRPSRAPSTATCPRDGSAALASSGSVRMVGAADAPQDRLEADRRADGQPIRARVLSGHGSMLAGSAGRHERGYAQGSRAQGGGRSRRNRRPSRTPAASPTSPLRRPRRGAARPATPGSARRGPSARRPSGSRTGSSPAPAKPCSVHGEPGRVPGPQASLLFSTISAHSPDRTRNPSCSPRRGKAPSGRAEGR